MNLYKLRQILHYNTPSNILMKGLHNIYSHIYGDNLNFLPCEMNAQKASDIIYEELASDKPSMIARFGSVEIQFAVNYIGVKKTKHNVIEYIKGHIPQYWYNRLGIYQLQNNAGFFPLKTDALEKYGEMIIHDAKYIDVLGSWRIEENYLVDINNIKTVQLFLLEPFHCSKPWTRILEGKRVLVVHPFADTILSQYKKRKSLFVNRYVLPEFDLEVVKAVQSIGGDCQFDSWFDALDYMKNEIDKHNFDYCLIGCGAYGIHLAAHVKRNGGKAIHLGGVLQMLFGIKGNRWLVPGQGKRAVPYFKDDEYLSLMNDSWTFPSVSEKPSNAVNVEGGCYW